MQSARLRDDRRVSPQPDLQEYLSVLLIKFSNVFFSDINLYDLNGKLLASSRPQIFEEGLISDRMNTRAYEDMAMDKVSNFIQQEKTEEKYLPENQVVRSEQSSSEISSQAARGPMGVPGSSRLAST